MSDFVLRRPGRIELSPKLMEELLTIVQQVPIRYLDAQILIDELAADERLAQIQYKVESPFIDSEVEIEVTVKIKKVKLKQLPIVGQDGDNDLVILIPDESI